MTRLLLLNLTDIVPDPNQPRKDFDPKKLRELAENIKAVGVKTPITVRPHGDKDGRPQYMIVVGERRWRASEWAGKECIPAVLAEEPGELTDDAVYLHQLSENLHRENLNPVEKADFLKTRLDMLKAGGFPNPVERLAEEIGVSKAWVTKNTAVLKYPEDIRALVRDGKFRDYRILSRLAALKGKKRQEVLTAIEAGTFTASSLQPRKRKAKATGNGTDELGLLPEEWISLIEQTPFLPILEAEDPDWRVNVPAAVARLRDLIAQP